MASSVLFLLSLSSIFSGVISQNGCSTLEAVCSMRGKIRGTITIGEKQGTGCFNNGNMQVIVDLTGFPGQSRGNNNEKDVYTIRLKTYGEIMPSCSGLGPDFGSGITAGEIGAFSPDSNGRIYNDTSYIPQTSSLQGRDTIIGRSLAIYSGPYSLYEDNVLIDCCVIGYGMPSPGSSRNQGTPGFFTGSNLGKTNAIDNNKFSLIGGYGENNPTFGFQSSPQSFGGSNPQSFGGSNPQSLYSGSPFYGNNNNNNNNNNINSAFGSNGNYNNIYNRGNVNYNTNRAPIFGSGTGTGNTQNNGSPSGAGDNRVRPSNNNNNINGFNNNNNNNKNGYTNSQFPSVFSNIGSPNFFNLDGKLAGAALVNGGPNSAAGLGGGRGNDDNALSSSLTQGFEPPKGPSFQDIYNKPTGSSPLSGGGFSDTVSPDEKNSISQIFFSDNDIKNTIGLTDEDRYIPRESEESESNTSYQSNSDEDPSEYNGENDDYRGDYNDNDNYGYEYGDEPPVDDNDNKVAYDPDNSPESVDPSENPGTNSDSDGPNEPRDVGPTGSSAGPKPIYRDNPDSNDPIDLSNNPTIVEN